MTIRSYSEVKKLQEGGAAPEQVPAQGAQDQMMAQLEQLAGQVLESLLQQVGDPNVVMQVLELAAQMLQEAVSQQAGAPVEEGQQYMKCGGKVKKASKAKKAAKK